MALLVYEDFEGGSLGTEITTSNTSAVNNAGIAPIFSSDAVEGFQGARFETAGAQSLLRFNHSGASVAWYSWYLKFLTLPEGLLYFASFYAENTQVGDIRIDSTGTLTVRSGFLAAIMTPAELEVGAWHRISVRIEPGAPNGLRLRTYQGSNLHGTTPDTDQSANSSVSDALTNFRLGVLTAGTITQTIDRLIGDDEEEPPPLEIASPTTNNAFIRVGGAWVPVAAYARVGGVWVPAIATLPTSFESGLGVGSLGTAPLGGNL